MQAILFSEYGSPDVLQVKEIEKPIPQDDEILIRVRATSVTYGDLMVRRMNQITSRDFNMPTPLLFPTRLMFGWSKPKKHILGAELAGDVVAIGEAVTQFKVGDQVFGYLGQSFGANAEYCTMPADGLVALKPTNMTYQQATCVPYGAMTAISLLRKANIQRGQTVLINGASGSIGSYAVQLAKYYGAEVTGVCGTPRIDFVREIGADHVIDYTQEDFTQNGKTYDLIMDILGKSTFGDCKNSLNPNGIYLLASFKIPNLIQMLMTSFMGDKKVICALSSDAKQDLLDVRDLAEAGVLTTAIDRTFPLAQTADAHRYVESGQKTGQVVIEVTT